MKYFGDVPQEHLNLVKELETLERLVRQYEAEMPTLTLAKALTCISHDYFSVEMEELGEKFLREVDKKCPGYFKGPIYVHIEKDDDYYYLVQRLKQSLALDVMKELGFES